MFHTLMLAVARQRGWETNKIDFIRVANLEGDSRIWFWPTDETDPDRIRLRRYRSRFSANLSTTMIKWKVALPTRQRNRYDILIDEKGESPVGPALYIDMKKVRETKWDKKKKETPAQQAAPTSQAPAQPETQPPASPTEPEAE